LLSWDQKEREREREGGGGGGGGHSSSVGGIIRDGVGRRRGFDLELDRLPRRPADQQRAPGLMTERLRISGRLEKLSAPTEEELLSPSLSHPPLPLTASLSPLLSYVFPLLPLSLSLSSGLSFSLPPSLLLSLFLPLCLSLSLPLSLAPLPRLPLFLSLSLSLPASPSLFLPLSFSPSLCLSLSFTYLSLSLPPYLLLPLPPSLPLSSSPNYMSDSVFRPVVYKCHVH